MKKLIVALFGLLMAPAGLAGAEQFPIVKIGGLPVVVIAPIVTPPYRFQVRAAPPWRDFPLCVQIHIQGQPRGAPDLAWGGNPGKACYVNPHENPAYIWAGIGQMELAINIERWPGGPVLVVPEAWERKN